MDGRPVVFIRYDDMKAEAALQPPAVEILLHGNAGAEQRDGSDSVGSQCFPGGIGDMKKRQARNSLDRFGDLVHRVGGDDEKIRAGLFQA